MPGGWLRQQLLTTMRRVYLKLSERQYRLGELEQRLLTLLRELGPNTRTYDLWQRYNDRYRTHLALGALYVALERLEKNEQVTWQPAKRAVLTGAPSQERRYTAREPVGSAEAG